uniref:PPIase cyclophilin-type domain-containing protein n=1 Tax=Attheya septentrionalis TaxID=420275 RepID=A0A7S2UKN4_9STRA|mmetsp:Transcript_29675/g.54356  ORF Transcript_29675/g.54356 Transcript_29675/m.54356 type:complete len:347 (+) Transcript_29675:118-1158(+)
MAMTRVLLPVAVLLLGVWVSCVTAWSSSPIVSSPSLATSRLEAFSISRPRRKTTSTQLLALSSNHDEDSSKASVDRRSFVGQWAMACSLASFMTGITPTKASAMSTSDAEITDKIYLEFKGIPNNNVNSEDGIPSVDRIVIGLFGKDEPQPVGIVKQLVSPTGYSTPCKPPDTTRLLEKERLESKKVYKSCVEGEDNGVTYDMSAVWRIDANRRIDVGSVTGKFVSRYPPNFESSSSLTHDAPGVVSVRRGNEGGFGFTIYPGAGGGEGILDEDNIVVGRVLEGMDVVERLNAVPVVQSSSINYMALTGGPKGQTAPTRACRYGGPMYCNELKPLKKILMIKTGIL